MLGFMEMEMCAFYLKRIYSPSSLLFWGGRGAVQNTAKIKQREALVHKKYLACQN